MLCEQRTRLFDTTVGTFLGPPFGSTAAAAKYFKRWSEEGADTGIEEPDTLLAQHKLSSPLDEMGYVLDTIKLQAHDWSRYVTSQLDTS